MLRQAGGQTGTAQANVMFIHYYSKYRDGQRRPELLQYWCSTLHAASSSELHQKTTISEGMSLGPSARRMPDTPIPSGRIHTNVTKVFKKYGIAFAFIAF